MSGYPYYNYAKLILNCNGANNGTTFTDSSSSGNAVTVGGNTKTSTGQFKFGSASAQFDGSGDYLKITNADFLPGTDDFTIHFWLKNDLPATERSVFSLGNSSNYFQLLIGAGGIRVNRSISGSPANDWSATLTSDTSWHHIEWSKVGRENIIFYDGAYLGSWVRQSWSHITVSDLYVGNNYNMGSGFQGYIDDFVYLKGIGLHTKDFTPPSMETANYQSVIAGNIVESLSITDWRVTVSRCADGSFAGSTTTSGSSYSVATLTTDPCNITVAPKIDYAWSAGKVVALNDYCVPIDPDATQRLFKATDIGSAPHQTHATTEPTWPSSGTVVDNDITWTYIADLVDPVSLGPKIPS
jgi:hypothetical protein